MLGSTTTHDKQLRRELRTVLTDLKFLWPECNAGFDGFTGRILTIRRHPHLYMLDELVSMQTLPATVADQLRGAVAARANILISGGTSSRKTTLLNALAATIPDHARILLIEAPSEIVLHKRNLIRLEARLEEIPSGQEKPLPPVPISQLLRTALRLRPDRIVVGETRSADGWDRRCNCRLPAFARTLETCCTPSYTSRSTTGAEESRR